LIVGDVVDLEFAGVDVAQDEVGRARCVDRGNARELPLQPDRPDESGAGELIVIDVVHFQPAGLAVAQQQIGFAGDAAEIADARELPTRTNRYARLEAAYPIAGAAVATDLLVDSPRGRPETAWSGTATRPNRNACPRRATPLMTRSARNSKKRRLSAPGLRQQGLF